MKGSHLVSISMFVSSAMVLTSATSGCDVSRYEVAPPPSPEFIAVSDGSATIELPSTPGVTNVSQSPYDTGGTSVLTHLPSATERFPIGQYYVDIPEGGTARIWFDTSFSMAELFADVQEGVGVEMTMKLFADVPGAVGTPSNISQGFSLKSGRNLVRLTPPDGFFDEPNGAPVAEVTTAMGGGPVKIILTTTPSAKLLQPRTNDGGGVAGDTETDEP